MPDDIAKLRTELQILDGHIQVERNAEVRHGLQRGRLEAERAQFLVKMMEAMAPTVTPAAIVTPPPYRITVQGLQEISCKPKSAPTPFIAAAVHAAHSSDAANLVKVPDEVAHHRRPHGIPEMPQMVEIILKGIGDGLRSRQIINQIRRQWWATMPEDRVYSGLNRLVKAKRVMRDGDRFKLVPVANGHDVQEGAIT